jgi:hypothetical protein
VRHAHESGDSDDSSAGSGSSGDSVELDGNQSEGCDYLSADAVTEAFDVLAADDAVGVAIAAALLPSAHVA